jgi:nucleotide-binding universal stress UspA family protein
MISRILVAVDDSAAAFHAADVAIALAADRGCTLCAVSVLQNHALDERISAASELVAGRRVLAGNAALRHVQRRAEAAGVAVDTVQVSGSPAPAVLAESRRWGADLVVIARASRQGVGVPYVGVEAQRILEFAEVPVLVVPPPP